MDYEFSLHYLVLCAENKNWIPSIEGARAFQKLVDCGLWAKWTSLRANKKPRFKWQEEVQAAHD